MEEKVRSLQRKGTPLHLLILIVKMETHNGCNAFAENVETEVLVGRMDGVAFETEAHEHRFHANTRSSRR